MLPLKVAVEAESTERMEGGGAGESTDLWMEKYRPRNYLDLLSEESVNRTLLHWLKLWDKVVFNKEVKIKAPKKEEPIRPKWAANPGSGSGFGSNSQFDKNKKFENKFPSTKKNAEGEMKEEFDSLGRPLQRVVLISGCPGLGKTTLAHVVARHAGCLKCCSQISLDVFDVCLFFFNWLQGITLLR